MKESKWIASPSKSCIEIPTLNAHYCDVCDMLVGLYSLLLYYAVAM